MALAAMLALGACSSDDDDEPAADDSAASEESSSDETDDVIGDLSSDVSDSDLIVPRDYLQGMWCDSDGENWTIEGETARLETQDGGVGEFPLGILFLDTVDVDLISQSDDEFVFGAAGEEVTFTRGAC